MADSGIRLYSACLVSKNYFDFLDTPVELVSPEEDIPMPYNHQVQLAAHPSVAKVSDRRS